MKMTYFVKVQIIQWSGRVKRRPGSADVKASADWGGGLDRPKGRPKTRWLVGVKRDWKKLGITYFFFEISNRTEPRKSFAQHGLRGDAELAKTECADGRNGGSENSRKPRSFRAGKSYETRGVCT